MGGRFLCRAAALFMIGIVSACAPAPVAPPGLVLDRASFAGLVGWPDDELGAALGAFLKSCNGLEKSSDATALGPKELGLTVADLRAACQQASAVPAAEPQAVRRFFETEFEPFRVRNGNDAAGLFTGYYEAEIRAARVRTGAYQVPIYRRPPELVSADLGLFSPDWWGRQISGHVVGGRLRPYHRRAEIESGALAGRGLELLWADDPVDVFFLQIQGSGRALLADGGSIRVGYDGQNGHPYVAIGRILADRGEMPRESVTLPAIRSWLAANPDKAAALLGENPSFVFFRSLPGDGPIGAQGVALTPGRSLAVDPAFIAYGLPLWLDAEGPDGPAAPRFRRLMIAQDTGGAIRGPVRGDIFFGHGPQALHDAGHMRGRGGYHVLLPRSAAARVASN